MERIGPILQEICLLSADALAAARAVQQTKGGRLGEILRSQNQITEVQLLTALGRQFGAEVVTHIDASDTVELCRQIPIQFLKKHSMVPFRVDGECRLAVNDPLNFQAMDDLVRFLGWHDFRFVLALKAVIVSAINAVYEDRGDAADQVIRDMRDDDTAHILSEIEAASDLLEDTSDAPTVKFVNLMLSQAVRSGASDVHLEPFQRDFKVRYRIDGILYDMFSPPKHIQSAIISRIKIMANLDIAEKRLPQDGRIEIRIADKNVDLRVSTIPISFGERVVLRLLDKSTVLLKLVSLGMPPDLLGRFNSLIHQSHGIVLVTGPTGSGKTTTLYAALATISKPDINILTIEDPVEYRFDGIGQMQVNVKSGLTFAQGLRSLVRQDPDVIMIGEIRDLETAKIAIQSALTGHLVFSTLHTNDSASAVTRLHDMGIEPFLISSAVNAILAQRLVRVLCPVCKEPYTPEQQVLDSIGMIDSETAPMLYREKGCPACLQTGYKGRCGIYELMTLDEELKSLILTTADANAIKQRAMTQGMRSLLHDGGQKALAGITTIEEVFRVTQQ
ncbi:MAG: type II secretion system ATPase GspE [Proteobacteria bacterium]|nr:type II secretion system protein GspE [Desulfobulbaceae bacterium]MBU4154047.1 type II secretion system ATPase GspE [Pseudomonadota bacterium]